MNQQFASRAEWLAARQRQQSQAPMQQQQQLPQQQQQQLPQQQRRQGGMSAAPAARSLPQETAESRVNFLAGAAMSMHAVVQAPRLPVFVKLPTSSDWANPAGVLQQNMTVCVHHPLQTNGGVTYMFVRHVDSATGSSKTLFVPVAIDDETLRESATGSTDETLLSEFTLPGTDSFSLAE